MKSRFVPHVTRPGFVVAVVVYGLLTSSVPISAGNAPSMDEYATIETEVNGVPVYSFSNIVYVYQLTPDFVPGMVMQQGNTNPVVKIKPKKSWEIKYNLCGSGHEKTPRTAWNDTQPFLPIHLIDGDPDTVWCSWGCAVPDGRDEWIRIDLPCETTISSVALVQAGSKFGAGGRYLTPGYAYFGRALSKDLTVKISRDAWHWDTVSQINDLQPDASGRAVVKFDPRPAKQILVLAHELRRRAFYNDYIFSFGELEVKDAAGNNVALLSRGAGVTVSSTCYNQMNDRFSQDALWGPLQYDLGNKWVRVGNDDGSFLWPFVEHERGKLQIDKRADECVNECIRNGVSVIMVLDIRSNWIYLDPPRKTDWLTSRFSEVNDTYNDFPGTVNESKQMMEAYLGYVDYMVRHFKGRFAYYEIGNEWNMHWWHRLSPQQYMKEIFEPVYHTIKKADPNARVMLGCTAPFEPELLLQCLGKQPDRPLGTKDGKLLAYGGTVLVRKGVNKSAAANPPEYPIPPPGIGQNAVKESDATVTVDAANAGECGIILRYRDPNNYLAGLYIPSINGICIRERVNGEWGPILGLKYVSAYSLNDQKGLGTDFHLSASVKGDQASFTLSDGTTTVSTTAAVKKVTGAGSVGLMQISGYDSQAFDNFILSDASGNVVARDDFEGETADAWDYAVQPPTITEKWAPKLDAIAWHPQQEPDAKYRDSVRRFKKDCESLGFRGRYFANEIYAGAMYPPGPPQTGSDIQMARFLIRSLVLHNGLDMEAGPCHPSYNGYPHPQSLCRTTWPSQTIAPLYPTITYYMWRMIATVTDDFHAAEFPVSFAGNTDPMWFTFRRGDGEELMVTAWIQGNNVNGIDEEKMDLTLPEVQAKRAWVIDIVNGTEQELNIARSGADTLIKGLLIKDVPEFIRVQK